MYSRVPNNHLLPRLFNFWKIFHPPPPNLLRPHPTPHFSPTHNFWSLIRFYWNHCIAITCVFKLGGVYMSISRRVKLNATASNYRRGFHFCLWERSCISKWPLMLAWKMTVSSQDLLEIAVIFYNLYLIVWLLSLLPCLWGILLGRKSLSVNDQLSFHNLYDMFGLQTCQTNCLLQANTPALHLRVGSKHHGKYGSHVLCLVCCSHFFKFLFKNLCVCFKAVWFALIFIDHDVAKTHYPI